MSTHRYCVFKQFFGCERVKSRQASGADEWAAAKGRAVASGSEYACGRSAGSNRADRHTAAQAFGKDYNVRQYVGPLMR